ncbi:hypothetical protein TNIN_326971 [Trichonephila inaurata madagascariensis]|uniref:RNase H type-1 domain-containing protein n=1 Tax=Trichonephila inaurata madagascariensis TaxID=2747483 RepID=A0A8X6XMZ6_9ARAC|nr:hypothetical protein TNIN_326971 [Trichonephila inaurata madagascariensis]
MGLIILTNFKTYSEFLHLELAKAVPRTIHDYSHSTSVAPIDDGIRGNEKADFLAEQGVLFMQKVPRPLSFHSIKNLIKRSIKARAKEDLYNRVSHNFIQECYPEFAIWPRRRVVAEFHLANRHDCLQKV